MRFTDEVLIAASVDRVWSLTEDIEGWPALTPTMTAVDRIDTGPLRCGSTARVKQPRLPAATWTVTEVHEPGRFVWETRLQGVRMAATHELEPHPGGCRNRLTLELSGSGASLLARAAGPAFRKAIATENDGFRRGAEGLDRPAYIDEHRRTLTAPPEAAWRAVEEFAQDLGDSAHPLLTRALGLQPDAGFAVVERQPERLLSLAGRHRFSRYVLDLRVAAVGEGAEVSAVSYGDFPGIHGLAYRTAVVGSRGHVLAVRRMLGDIAARA